MIISIALGMIYAALVEINTGFLLADFQALRGKGEDRDTYREDLGFSILISLIPLSWIMTPFITGFYQHGWMLRRRK